MPDIPDPYEERGVDPPHPIIPYDELMSDCYIGHGSSNLPPPKMTDAEVDKERKRIRAKEAKRIRPGFYFGSDPLGDGLD